MGQALNLLTQYIEVDFEKGLETGTVFVEQSAAYDTPEALQQNIWHDERSLPCVPDASSLIELMILHKTA